MTVKVFGEPFLLKSGHIQVWRNVIPGFAADVQDKKTSWSGRVKLCGPDQDQLTDRPGLLRSTVV